MSDLIDNGWNSDSPPLQGRGKGWGLSDAELTLLHERAREMRNNPTEPEKRLWWKLSNRQLGGFKFRRQEVIGRAIADFFCPSAGLIVEVDGDTHADPVRDRRRDAYLGGIGYSVLHVTNPEVMRNIDGVLIVIQQALESGDSPHPNPSPEEEGLKEVEAQKLLGISLEGSVG
jgi:very-short-patch-repair endonuclease